MEGIFRKKKSLSVLIERHSVVNTSVVLDEWLNTNLPHNYSLPSKSPLCLGAQCIKHICHGSPSPSLLAAAAHALFLTFMMEVWKGVSPSLKINTQMWHRTKTVRPTTTCCDQINNQLYLLLSLFVVVSTCLWKQRHCIIKRKKQWSKRLAWVWK